AAARSSSPMLAAPRSRPIVGSKRNWLAAPGPSRGKPRVGLQLRAASGRPATRRFPFEPPSRQPPSRETRIAPFGGRPWLHRSLYVRLRHLRAVLRQLGVGAVH